MAMEELRGKQLRWLNITNAKDENCPEIKYLKKNFNFHASNLKESVSSVQRPKIDEYADHLFLVLIFPHYNRKTREIVSAEVDFFVTKEFIISIHDGQLEDLVRFFNHLKKTKNKREKDEFLANNVIIVLYSLLNRLLGHCFPILDHLNIDIRKIEKEIFSGKEKEMVREILITRRNIVNFRKAMQAHKNVLKKLKEVCSHLKFFDPIKADTYFNNLIERTKEIWDHLESSKESIDALYDTNESLISFHLNVIMKTFTVISVVIFILTLVASLFSMNALHTPFIHWPGGFWLIILLEFVVALLVITFFRRRKWLE